MSKTGWMSGMIVSLLTAHSLQLSAVFAVDVEPQRVELTIPEDEVTEATLEISNRGSRAVQVKLQTGPYRAFQPGLTFPSAQNLIQFEMDTFTLAPKANSTVSYAVTPPPNVEQDTAGEYLAAILVDEWPAEKAVSTSESGATLTVVPRLAIPVYLKIQGREWIEVGIEEVRIQDQASDSSSDLLNVTTSLRNRGTVHVRPTGTVALFEAQ